MFLYIYIFEYLYVCKLVYLYFYTSCSVTLRLFGRKKCCPLRMRMSPLTTLRRLRAPSANTNIGLVGATVQPEIQMRPKYKCYTNTERKYRLCCKSRRGYKNRATQREMGLVTGECHANNSDAKQTQAKIQIQIQIQGQIQIQY